jgi:hypothetical protein
MHFEHTPMVRQPSSSRVAESNLEVITTEPPLLTGRAGRAVAGGEVV